MKDRIFDVQNPYKGINVDDLKISIRLWAALNKISISKLGELNGKKASEIFSLLKEKKIDDINLILEELFRFSNNFE
jgi:hypothetical protein